MDIVSHILQLVAMNEVNLEIFEFIFVMEAALNFTTSAHIGSSKGITKVLVNSANANFPELCNSGFRVARGYQLIFLSQSLRIDTQGLSFLQDLRWMVEVLLYTQREPSTAIFGPKILANDTGAEIFNFFENLN